MTTLERLALLRAEEQMQAPAPEWRLRFQPAPRPKQRPRRDLIDSRRCGMGCGKQLTARNGSGICRLCWHRMTPKRRREWLAERPQEAA